LVLGQGSFTTSTDSTTQAGLSFPHGVGFDSQGDLWVADGANNRVLEYACTASSSCVNGNNATQVIGQPSFTAGTYARTQTGLSFPHGVGFDSQGDLWVADEDNNRVLEYAQAQLLVTVTVTSTVSSTSYVTQYSTTTVTSYTGTSTSTSTIPTLTTVVLVPLTVTSTAQSTQYLTSTFTTTVTSYTSTVTSTSTSTVTVTEGTDTSTSSSTTATSSSSASIGTSVTTTSVTASSGHVAVKGYLKDANGNGLANLPVRITVDGGYLGIVTTTSGGSFSYTGLGPTSKGSHIVTVWFYATTVGTTQYTASSATRSYTI